jgi:RAQPRD family integrative conjugative element protein
VNQNRRSIVTLAIMLTSFATLVPPTTSLADAETERTELARLIHELEQLERLIAQAEASADSSQRVHFQYDWLRTDLARVRAGIREYLEGVPLTPRTVTPLAGDYIR